MSPPLAKETREQLESRFRYDEDLGMRSFYRERLARTAAGETTAASSLDTARGQGEKEPVVRAGAAASRAPVTPVTKIPTLPIVQGPSLFEAAERVEGDTLDRIREDVGDCTRCRLHRHRTNIVFGIGTAKAELVFIGDGTGDDEDIQSIPFVSRSGPLLT